MSLESLINQEPPVQAPHALEADLSPISEVPLARGLRLITAEGVLAPSQAQAEAAAAAAARTAHAAATCLSA